MQPIEIKMGDVRAEITLLGSLYRHEVWRNRWRVEVWRETVGQAKSMTQFYGTQGACFAWILRWAEATADAKN